MKKITLLTIKGAIFAILMKGKTLIVRLATNGTATGLIFLGTFVPLAIQADPIHATETAKESAVAENCLPAQAICNSDSYQYKAVKTIKMIVTAYSSTPDQTWGDPFITASGKRVEDGIVANNMLPFGTKIRIPEIYGDKVFTVQDRLHQRKGKYHVDIWFETTRGAKEFGVKMTEIEILDA